MERNRPVETSQPVKEDNLFKQTVLSSNLPIGSTKNICSIYFLSGITGIFMSMVNNPCVTQLLSVLHNTGQSLDKNIQTDIIYLDFAKAFDPVDHDILLHKLKLYGVSGHLHEWFADDLSGRCQRVVIDGVVSFWAPVNIWSSTRKYPWSCLFALFINDLPNVLPNETMGIIVCR